MTLLSVTRLFRDPTLAIESEPYDVSPAWIEALEARLERAGEKRPAIRWFDHGEHSLAGGWEGFGGRRRLTLSRSVGELPPEVAAGLVLREIGHRRKKHRWISCLVERALAGGRRSHSPTRRIAGSSGRSAPPAASSCWRR